MSLRPQAVCCVHNIQVLSCVQLFEVVAFCKKIYCNIILEIMLHQTF